jgi:hypothetical protein
MNVFFLSEGGRRIQVSKRCYFMFFFNLDDGHSPKEQLCTLQSPFVRSHQTSIKLKSSQKLVQADDTYLVISEHLEPQKLAAEVTMYEQLTDHHATQHRQQPHQHLQGGAGNQSTHH